MQMDGDAADDDFSLLDRSSFLHHLIRDGPPSANFSHSIDLIRWKAVDERIKSDIDGMPTWRIYAWLLLLDCPTMNTRDYLSLVRLGASPAYAKIRNDTFRTLTTDPLFRRRVSEASLIRLLNAISWKLEPNHTTAPDSRIAPPRDNTIFDEHIRRQTPPADEYQSQRPSLDSSLPFTLDLTSAMAQSESNTYLQGMNVLAAPFLYAARSEAQAFVAFHTLLTRECPSYIRGAMDGVHRGLTLVDKVLAIVDPELSQYLLGKGMSAKIYAFPSVLTLSACTPPLPEVLRLWDFLFAFGTHLNIICVVAQLLRIRDDILSSPSPNKFLRSFPPLCTNVIKKMTLSIVQKIPNDLYNEIVIHMD